MNLNLLNVETRVKQLTLNHVHKIFYNLCPSYLQENFVPLIDVHHHNTRSSGYNFLVPNCKGVEDSTLYYIGIKDWNSLPEWLKQIESPQKFKIALKKYLIEYCCATKQKIFLYYWVHNISPLSVVAVLIAVIIIHSAIMPAAHTFGQPYALGTLFLEIRGWFAVQLNVKHRFQFLDGSVCRSLGPLVCVTDVIVSSVFLFGAFFGDKNRFTFIGLSVLTCAIYIILSHAKVLYVPKWTPLEISHFGFMDYP